MAQESLGTPDVLTNKRPIPTRWSTAVFVAKATAFQTVRALSDLRSNLKKYPIESPRAYPFAIAESITPLWPDTRLEEVTHQRGKIQNLRRAAASLHGVAIPAGGIFSFWKHVGRPTGSKGYVEGRMLQQGCLVPSVGGGLCQLSNALFDVCLQAGCEVLERHRHSRIVPGSAALVDRDATVAWNYVDLRFRPRIPVLLEVFLTETEFVVRLRGVQPLPPHPTLHHPFAQVASLNNCSTCGEQKCFRHPQAPIHRA